jgi:hypothetical protein
VETIFLDSIGGRAEAIVVERIGGDWVYFMPGAPVSNIPLYYAQGNQALAVTLLHDALVQFACMQLMKTGQLPDLTATSIKTADQTITGGMNYAERIANFQCLGQAALDLLRRPFPVAGRTFVSPSAGASGQLCQTIRTRVGCRGWGWPDDGRGW